MFNKKNDPLVESVKAVMKQNEVHRQAEAALNEELGISSKKALPHEYHAQYDALLEAKVFHAEKKLAGQRVRNIVGAAADETVKKIKGALSNESKPTDRYKEMVKREIPEETDYSSKQKKLAMLGNVSGHGGDPEEIDGPDLSAARKGHAHKVGLEEKKLTSAETSKKEELVKKMKKGDWSKRYGKRGREVMYATATKMAEKLAEAEGDVNPSEMTPISKGLQDRIVKDPPKPKPETKQMNEVRILGPKGVGQRAVKKVFGTPEEKGKLPGDREPKPVDVRTAKVRLASQSTKYSMKESVIEEIRENLEANLIAIHESGDDELFENYVNSLTEEELEILGLNEAERESGIGKGWSGLATSIGNVGSAIGSGISRVAGTVSDTLIPKNSPPRTDGFPGQTSTADQNKMPGEGTTNDNIGDLPVKSAPAAPAAARPAPATDMGGYTDKQIPKTSDIDMGGYTDKQIPKTPAARPAPAPVARPTTPAPSAQRPMRPAASRPAMGSHTPFGAYGGSAGPLSLEESVKPQVKQSLESFLRNRFLKG